MSPCLSFSISSLADFLVDEQRGHQAGAQLGARPPTRAACDARLKVRPTSRSIRCSGRSRSRASSAGGASVRHRVRCRVARRAGAGTRRAPRLAANSAVLPSRITLTRSSLASASGSVSACRRCGVEFDRDRVEARRWRSPHAPRRRWPARRARCRAGCSARRRVRRWRAAGRRGCVDAADGSIMAVAAVRPESRAAACRWPRVRSIAAPIGAAAVVGGLRRRAC